MSKKHRSVAFVDRARIEFVILADYAQVANGKLDMIGAGWTDHHRAVMNGQPAPSIIAIALSVYVPWNDTNRPHDLSVTVENDDGSVLFKFDGKVNAGRPPQLPPGSGQYAPLAFSGITTYPKAGGYRVIARLNGNQDTRTWPFRVHDVPQQGQLAS